jgi:predicted amino acid racemase
MSVLKYNGETDINSLAADMAIGQALTRALMKRMNENPEFRRKLAIAEQELKKVNPKMTFRLGRMYIKQAVNDAISRADAKMQAKQEEITNKKLSERMKKNVAKLAD